MIIFILSAASLACVYAAFQQGRRAKFAEESVIEKESIITALQAHTNRLDMEFTKLNAELAATHDQIKSLKSHVQSLIDKAKNKAKAEKAVKNEKVEKTEKKAAVIKNEVVVKEKRKYNKKALA